jgi:hypothetical protein
LLEGGKGEEIFGILTKNQSLRRSIPGSAGELSFYWRITISHEKLYLTFSSSPLSEEAIGRRRCASMMKLAKGREEKGPHNLLRLRRRRKMEKKCDMI